MQNCISGVYHVFSVHILEYKYQIQMGVRFKINLILYLSNNKSKSLNKKWNKRKSQMRSAFQSWNFVRWCVLGYKHQIWLIFIWIMYLFILNHNSLLPFPLEEWRSNNENYFNNNISRKIMCNDVVDSGVCFVSFSVAW